MDSASEVLGSLTRLTHPLAKARFAKYKPEALASEQFTAIPEVHALALRARIIFRENAPVPVQDFFEIWPLNDSFKFIVV